MIQLFFIGENNDENILLPIPIVTKKALIVILSINMKLHRLDHHRVMVRLKDFTEIEVIYLK